MQVGKRGHTSPPAFGDNHIDLIGPDVVTDGHSAKALIGQLIDPRNELLIGQSPIVQPMVQHRLIGRVCSLFRIAGHWRSQEQARSGRCVSHNLQLPVSAPIGQYGGDVNRRDSVI